MVLTSPRRCPNFSNSAPSWTRQPRCHCSASGHSGRIDALGIHQRERSRASPQRRQHLTAGLAAPVSRG
eukprot:15312842-Alexandrium_andersonii.AAC.1